MIFNLLELGQGAVAEKIDKALGVVLENMQDPNTSAGAKRKLVITLTYLIFCPTLLLARLQNMMTTESLSLQL